MKTPKVTKNLSLDAGAVRRGERYSKLHHTNLSRLVSNFLKALPVNEPARELSPAVSRLLGVAVAGTAKPTSEPDPYHDHLWTKYGRV
ncbi:MAG: DUF6364 family protein [Candidatus Sulfotelmatobacter sp.]